MKFISFVVLSFRRFDTTTGPCLASLEPVRDDHRLELVLVDNHSDDGSAERCAEWAAARRDVVWRPQAQNLGFGGGMNAGVAASHAEWVCLVNSDTIFPPGAVRALISALSSLPTKVAMVGPVTNEAGAGQRLPLPDLPFEAVPPVAAEATHARTHLFTPQYRTDFFCVAVRRAVWQQLGGLDPVFGLGYYEDFDFSLRLARAGFEQVIAEDVFIAHAGSAAFKTLGAEQRALMRRNRALMAERHPDVRFEHVREGNVHALEHLVEVAQHQGWTDALRKRAAWRLAALLWDEPKSPFKRWRWRWATRGIRRVLAAHGVQAAFPGAGRPRSTGTDDGLLA